MDKYQHAAWCMCGYNVSTELDSRDLGGVAGMPGALLLSVHTCSVCFVPLM